MLDIETTALLTDTEIVDRSLVDRNFFAVVVERYEDKLTRYLRRLGVYSHEDRQDILQEIFIKVYRNLNGFDKGLSFSSWIYRITHNEAISWHRKQKVRPEGHLVDNNEELFQYIESDLSPVENLIDAKIDANILKIALGLLEIKYRDPIILRFFEHKDYEEISDILKIPIGTVGTLIARGKKKLEPLLAEYNVNDT